MRGPECNAVKFDLLDYFEKSKTIACSAVVSHPASCGPGFKSCVSHFIRTQTTGEFIHRVSRRQYHKDLT